MFDAKPPKDDCVEDIDKWRGMVDVGTRQIILKIESVTSPSYYWENITIQPMAVIEDWNLGFHLGNVVKYLCRYKDKNGIDDLKKARWYLDRFIERHEDG